MKLIYWFILGMCCGFLNAGEQFSVEVITEEQLKQAAPEPGKPYWVMFSATYCAPCKQWQATEKPIMEKAGYTVTVVHCDTDPNWPRWKKRFEVSRYPTFFLLDRTTRETLIGPVEGTKSAVLMIRDINRWGVWPKKVDAVTTRLTCPEIRALVRSRYQEGQDLSFDVSPRGNVWSHLTSGADGSHTFTADQVSCLTLWEALALHDDAHSARTIRPDR